MSFALDILTITAVSAGAFFFLAGTVGLLRFPDPLTRLHALTKADNLGLGLVVLGLLPQAGSLRGGLKLICVWLLVLLAGATVSQLIARAALASDSERPGAANGRPHDHRGGARDRACRAGAGHGGVDDRRARDLRRGRGLRRLRAVARARVGASGRRRRGVDRGRDRRPERHPAGGRGRPPARQRDAGGGGVARMECCVSAPRCSQR